MRRVALIIETSRSYGRDLLSGVKRYAAEQASWSMFVELRDLESQPPSWLRNWDGDGILTRSGNPAIQRAVTQVGVPTVELRSSRLAKRFPFVGVDNHAVGEMVASHFLELGFEHFGIYRLDTEQFFIDRRNSFVAHLDAAGFKCEEFHQSGATEKPNQWERQQARLCQWIQQLPKPAAILACTDQLGCWLLDACRRADVRVPEQIAVVGVENDETLTTISTPTLSSVQLDGHRIGYQAARLLDRMMKGGKPRTTPLLIPPIGVITRQSSDIVATSDPLLAAAIRFIRQHACEGIRIANVLDAVPLSRSQLERGCRELLQRSPNQEMNRIRIQAAKELLRDTELSIQRVAARTGFTTQQYFVQLFKKHCGMTATAYRRSVRELTMQND
ncbi:DNA-binding transcriptional regulator [Novipirellula rosea]|uniref:AraC family transcriptional regulator n=1 Tax=Novipirellula rosea TaxID=1031540 RepID=UPI0030ED3BF3